MKRLVLLLSVTILVLIVAVAAKDPADSGIRFYKASWKDVLTKAKAEHKPIFIDIYATWCKPCKALKNTTFTNEEVGHFFNHNFINATFDGEQADGAMLAGKYNIEGYPTMLMFDENEKPLMQIVGYNDPKTLLKTANEVLKKYKH